MRTIRLAALTLSVLFLALTAPAQGTYVTFGGQSKQAAIKSFNKGKLAARRDLAKGKLKIKSFGFPDGYQYCYGQILTNDYGIELDWVAGCVVWPSLANEVSGYNSVMEPAIDRKFGKGTLGRVEKLAEECPSFQPISLDDLRTTPLLILTFPLPSIDLPPPLPPVPKKDE